MYSATEGPETIDDLYIRQHDNPRDNVSDIVAVLMIRDPGSTPGEPLRVSLDRSALDHMGWQAGDSITMVSAADADKPGEGTIIIRKANPGEIALVLPELPPTPPESGTRIHHFGPQTMGPAFEWCFPSEWVETFFPGYHDSVDGEFISFTARTWKLADILDQAEHMKLRLQGKDRSVTSKP